MLTNQVGYVQAKEHLNFDIGASFEVGKYEPAHLGMEALSRQRPVILVHEPGEWINAPCMVKLKEVITLSREEALRLNQDYIGIEHLLLGLIRDGDGLAIKTLSNLEVDPEMLRKTIEDCISNKLAKTNSKPNNISLTKSAENVLKFAVIERITMKSDAIGTEHLLLSILKDKDNLATQLINQYDINYGIFKAQLDSINPTKR
jgi:ATP-dependent Clp protease ATP-binding subunit ClpA